MGIAKAPEETTGVSSGAFTITITHTLRYFKNKHIRLENLRVPAD
ncbi:hypothetical protein J2S62_002122 [Enteractinococcus fodinae]|uniref:Uncharacterized protein n=1 Tax=Enteractinococcus fodinae TaxID=684663 RepID=A0ABU2B2N0_9MICC|nr:hypothetical protein [Enteractinococcus fodinae]